MSTKGKSQKSLFFLFSLPCRQFIYLLFRGRDFNGKTDAGPHGDFIFQFDHVVGALLAKLEKLKIADNTLVIVTSDNGPGSAHRDQHEKTHNHDGARPWRGVKRDNWEGDIGYLFLVRWPKMVKPGSVSDQIICQTDIMSTCASLVGYDLPVNSAEDSFDIFCLVRNMPMGFVRPYVIGPD